MKRLPPLNEKQQQLVQKNLTVIHWAIHNFVKINETVFGFEYDDLYGEGCVLLCKAAATYDSEKGRFSAYAQTAMDWAVASGLITGTTDTTLTPDGSATRAQVATIFQRFQEDVAK